MLVLLLLSVLLVGPELRCGASSDSYTIPLWSTATDNAGPSDELVISYYAQVGIGSPPRQFLMQFDTDLNDTFLPLYQNSPEKTNLRFARGYNPDDSSKARNINQDASIFYQQCRLDGSIFEDELEFSLRYQDELHLRLNFTAVRQAETDVFKNLPVDGFFGLKPEFIASLHEQGAIKKGLVSIFLKHPTSDHQGGHVTLGGFDEKFRKPQIDWHPTISEGSWDIELNRVSVGANQLGCLGGECKAIFKSGINPILGPKSEIDEIHQALGVTVGDNGLPYIHCDRINELPSINFKFDQTVREIKPANYVRKVVGDKIFGKNTCLIYLHHSQGKSNEWILGTSFLTSVYSFYDADNKQVGFAAIPKT